MKKLAIIRGDGVRECPFGLPLTSACHKVGSSVDRMHSILKVEPREAEAIKKSNRKIFRHYAGEGKCPYAEFILDTRNVVNCDYGQAGAGEEQFNPNPYSLSPSIFNGLWPTGLLSFPMSFYRDNMESRTVYPQGNFFSGASGEIDITKKFGDDLLIDLAINDELE